MKPDRDLLLKCYIDAMIMQYKRDLEKKGFIVSLGYKIHDLHIDVYAEKDSEKRAYNFKLVGKENYVKWNIVDFKETAEVHGITAYAVYVNPPDKKQIDFDDLSKLLTDHFIDGETPTELDELSTQVRVDKVELDELTGIDIANEVITIDGYASICVELYYDSGHAMKHTDGVDYTDRFPMSFCARLGYNDAYFIKSIDYEIDTSNWYGHYAG